MKSKQLIIVFCLTGYGCLSQINTPSGIIQGNSQTNNVVLGNSVASQNQLGKLHIDVSNGTSASAIKGIQIDVTTEEGVASGGGPGAESLSSTGAFTITRRDYTLEPSFHDDVFHISLDGSTHIGHILGSGKLNVRGNAQFYFGSEYSSISSNKLDWTSDGLFKMRNSGTNKDVLCLSSNGSVAIGGLSFAEGYVLNINGKAIAEEVLVRLQSNWPDYVFSAHYDLMPLQELRKYIVENEKLPNMPSAKQIEQNGLPIAETQVLMMEKIEELTLYVLELKEDLEDAKATINKLQK